MTATLDILLPPSSGRVGFPWTQASRPMPLKLANDLPWPRITVVTPFYNQAPFLEETIRSVLLQGYPDLEYIVIDGGSTDGIVEIIRKYATHLSYWVSEKDQGQTHAINKGFERNTGDIMGWVNSDDLLLPNALRHTAEAFMRSDSLQATCGFRKVIDAQSRKRYNWFRWMPDSYFLQ